MENNSKPFFDPYILNTQIASANANNYAKAKTSIDSENAGVPSLDELKNISSSIPSATKFYEEQYMYFKYLSQVVDYKTRLFEYEKLTKMPNETSQRGSVQK